MADRMDGLDANGSSAPNRRSNAGAQLVRPVPPPVRRDVGSRPVPRSVRLSDTKPVGRKAAPSDLPTFTRTTGGTITTFLPTEPPGRGLPVPALQVPEPKPRIGNDSHDPFFATDTGEIENGHSPFASTPDVPAGTVSPQERPIEAPLRSTGQAGPQYVHSDDELDALLADLSAAKHQTELAPIRPAPQLQSAPQVRPRPERAPVERRSEPHRQGPPVVRHSRPQKAEPQPWGPQHAPQQRQSTRRIVPPDSPAALDSPTALDHRAPIAPGASLPLGASQEYLHLMDGEIGQWVRIVAVLLACGIGAGAVAFAIFS